MGFVQVYDVGLGGGGSEVSVGVDGEVGVPTNCLVGSCSRSKGIS